MGFKDGPFRHLAYSTSMAFKAARSSRAARRRVSHCRAFAAIETARRYVSLGRSCFLWLKKFSLNGRREVVVV